MDPIEPIDPENHFFKERPVETSAMDLRNGEFTVDRPNIDVTYMHDRENKIVWLMKLYEFKAYRAAVEMKAEQARIRRKLIATYGEKTTMEDHEHEYKNGQCLHCGHLLDSTQASLEIAPDCKVSVRCKPADPNDPPAELSIRASDPPVVTVGDDFPLQQARVLQCYANAIIIPGCAFYADQARAALCRSFDAAIEGDILKILASYEELKGFKE